MGQACCSYAPKDANNENFGGKTIEKRNGKTYMIDAEKAAKALAHGKLHLDSIIKLQAFARGCLSRARHGRTG